MKNFKPFFPALSLEKGIDSLVRSLAGLEVEWLKLLLAAPVILGVTQGIIRTRGAYYRVLKSLKKLPIKFKTQLEYPSSFWRDIILEKIPLSSFLSLSNHVQKLEQWVRWDGRLDSQSRKQAFELIRRVAREGDKITQLNALNSLAKIAHGIGLKDLPRLRQAGYSPTELSDLLSIKATALADLIELSSPKMIEENKTQSKKRRRLFVSTPRRLYASYLIWWLGQSTSWWTQRLPFALLKIVKLGLEALFLQKIAASILEAIACPDKPGFQLGNGYQDWASDYTAKCFTARVNFFRMLDTNESVDALAVEIPQYHLTELTILDLYNKYLTSDEASQIIQAVVKQGAPLQALYLGGNQISVLSKSTLSGLSQLTSLNLNDNQLNDTAIQNITQNFPYQLNQLYVSHNQISDDGALALAKILPCTNLTTINFVGNPANNTTLVIAAQQTALQKVCDDQRCHANLPATESCDVNTNPSITTQWAWGGLFGSAVEMDKTESDSSDYSYWLHPAETPSFQSTLALTSVTPESTSPSLTPAAMGVMMLGVLGLSVLLYKNSTWMQAIVNTGSRFFQHCWRGGKTEEAKTISPVSSSNRRYTLFPHLPAICSRKSSSFTTTTSVVLH